jgi:hypothetical protein
LNKSSNYDDTQILLQDVFGLNRNVVNPFLVGNTVLYGNNNNNNVINPLNMIVQNWLTPT